MNADESNTVFWQQLPGYSFLYLLGAQITALLLAWATRIWGAKPPGLYFLYKDHRAQSWIRFRTFPSLGNLGFRTLQDLSPEAEPHFHHLDQPVTSWVHLRRKEHTSLARPSGVHHLPPSTSLLPLHPPCHPLHEISFLLCFLSLLIYHLISGKKLFFIYHTHQPS